MTKTLWTPAEEARLLALRNSGVSPRDLADRFDRSLKAAMLEGFRFIGIERDEQYMGIARARIGGAL